ncbi:hypothetical protein Tco_1076843 [Tanacetum coccineum]
MIGVPRSIAEHRLNVREGCQPIRKKRRGQAPDRNKAIQEEVAKMVKAEIMREVHYHDWLSNPVMRCEDTNLSLNWEKSHFMVKEGIVLGHKISKSGLEVDKAKVEVIAKLPHPTTVSLGTPVFTDNSFRTSQKLPVL